jgi:hypothetical protein
MSQIPAIPQNADGLALVNHINDRLRRISLALGTGAAGTPGPPGRPGTPGSGGTAGNEPVYTIVAAPGPAFTPLLAQSLFQLIVLAADSDLNAPSGTPVGGATKWTLIVDNPTGGQLTLTPDPLKYFLGFEITLDANTRAQITWTNDQNDYNSAAGSSFNGSIPPSS